MYSNKIMELFVNPENAGFLKGNNGAGKFEDEKMGEVYKFSVLVNENTNIVEKATFKTQGCVVAIAASSALTMLVEGRTTDDLLEFDIAVLEYFLGDFPEDRLICLQNAIVCMQNAVKDYLKKQEKKLRDLQKQNNKTV